MGFRTLKYGVNEQQLRYSRESGPGQMATRSRSQMIESEAAMSCLRWNVRWRASMAAATSNSAAMSSQRWHVRWLGIYGCGLSLSSVLI